MRKTRDPIDLTKKRILEAGFATEKELKVWSMRTAFLQFTKIMTQAVEARVRKEINDAIQAAKDAEFPDNLELYKDIFKNEIPQYIRGTEISNGHGKLL